MPIDFLIYIFKISSIPNCFIFKGKASNTRLIVAISLNHECKIMTGTIIQCLNNEKKISEPH